MAETYLIGDTHFGHSNILVFEKDHRNFKDITDHDETLIKNWNSVVTLNDTVIHLGDVAFGKFDITKLNLLNGRKYLVMGNHDNFARLRPYFAGLYGVKYGKEGIVFTHIPIHESQFSRFKLNVHGHLHSKSLKDVRYYNVSCEMIGLSPLNIDVVYRRLKTINGNS